MQKNIKKAVYIDNWLDFSFFCMKNGSFFSFLFNFTIPNLWEYVDSVSSVKLATPSIESFNFEWAPNWIDDTFF